ncbi:Serine/threonine-protein kinase 19 [Savitreella phatthalungensis]
MPGPVRKSRSLAHLIGSSASNRKVSKTAFDEDGGDALARLAATAPALPVPARDFTGIDILAAIDYLKQLQAATRLPPMTSRDQRTEILVHRREMPSIVLAHMVSSLFPNATTLERDQAELRRRGRIIQIPLGGGAELALMRVEDFDAPAALRDAILAGHGTIREDVLEPNLVGDLVSDGYLVRDRRDGSLAPSVPNVGLYLRALRACRRWVLTALVRAKGILDQALLVHRYSNWKEGKYFLWQTVLHDLVGSGRAEILQLGTGTALRITRRGRLDK